MLRGGKEVRVPEGPGVEASGAARRRGTPGRFLHFPNEGYRIGRPQNRVFFHWLGRTLTIRLPPK